MNGRRTPLLGLGIALAGVLALGGAYVLEANGPVVAHPYVNAAGPGGMMNGWGMMGGRGMMGGGGMMGGRGMMGGTWAAPSQGAGPGEAGFVAGTTSAPRVVRVYALPNDRFTPDSVAVKAGETITFEVTTMGPATHEFMVGPAADVAADKEGTPEASDIGMMQTKSVTFTFSGSGPFSFACHEPGHYEAGMTGTIVVK